MIEDLNADNPRCGNGFGVDAVEAGGSGVIDLASTGSERGSRRPGAITLSSDIRTGRKRVVVVFGIGTSVQKQMQGLFLKHVWAKHVFDGFGNHFQLDLLT